MLEKVEYVTGNKNVHCFYLTTILNNWTSYPAYPF